MGNCCGPTAEEKEAREKENRETQEMQRQRSAKAAEERMKAADQRGSTKPGGAKKSAV